MKFSLTLKEAVYLKVGLELLPGMKETYDKLVVIYMGVAGCDLAEAQATIFPEFAMGVIRTVEQLASAEQGAAG